jgi:hypothetical protein
MSKESTKAAFLKTLSDQLNSLQVVSDSSAGPLNAAPTLINALRKLAKGQPIMLLNHSPEEEDSLSDRPAVDMKPEEPIRIEQRLKSKTPHPFSFP